MTKRDVAAASVAERYEPLDAVLGPSDQRYFGAGYRDVAYDVSGVMLGNTLRGAGALGYPQDWSVGTRGGPRTPHLSSVDAVVLPVMLLEKCMPSRELHDLFISSIELRAGSRAWEKLEEVPVHSEISKAGRHLNLRSVAGNIRVRITLTRHGKSFSAAAAGLSVYGRLFQSTRSDSLIRTDSVDDFLAGRHRMHFGRHRAARGVEAFAWPGPTVLDYLVVLGQMTQALVYTSAGVTRSTAGPLWMRTMRVERSTPPGPEDEFDSVARVVRDRLLVRSGQRVHDVQVSASTTTGVNAVSALAYVEDEAG